MRLLLRGIQVRQADVMGIDFAEKTVTVVQGFRRVPVDLPYDELVIALGMSVDLNRFPGLPEHALTMKNLADAHRLRTHVISCLEMADVATEPELKRELLTFVVVGAGFTGVETVAEVQRSDPPRAEILHEHQARGDPRLPHRICRPHLAHLPGGPRRICDAAP